MNNKFNSTFSEALSSISPELSELTTKMIDLNKKLNPAKADLINTLIDIKKDTKSNKPLNTQKNSNNTKSNKKTQKNKRKQKPKEIDKPKDIYKDDCICDDIKSKNANKTNTLNTSNLTNINQIGKYMLLGEILGSPACKKNRVR